MGDWGSSAASLPHSTAFCAIGHPDFHRIGVQVQQSSPANCSRTGVSAPHWGTPAKRDSGSDQSGWGRVGKVTMFATEGSSRNFTYTDVPSIRGTRTLVSAKPIGIDTVCLNSESAATESIRKSFAPISVHCSSGLVGQRISFKEGVRTRVTRGCQSPFAPVASTGRNRSGPKADTPKLFSGSSVAKTSSTSCSTRSPSATLKSTVKELSAAATSIFSVLRKVFGISVCKEKTSRPSCGRFSGFSSLTGEGLAPGCTVLLTRVTLGRAVATAAGTSKVLPSLRLTCAVNAGSDCPANAGLE